jgi:hypothetical protein
MTFEKNNKYRLKTMRIALVCMGFLWSLNIFAQRDLKSESVFTPIYGLTYKASFPGGDFADRWGFSNAIGAEVNFKLKSNLSFGIESQFLLVIPLNS